MINKDKINHIFQFWKAVEALSPQKIDKDNPDDKRAPAYNVACGGLLPWHDPKHLRKRMAPGKVWNYSVQFGVYGIAPFAKLLEENIGRHEEVFDDRLSGKSRLFDIRFNEQGLPLYESFTLSLPAWATGQILQHNGGALALSQSIPSNLTGLPSPSELIPEIDSGFSDFDVLTQGLMQWVQEEASRLQREAKNADIGWLEQLAKLICEKTHFPDSIRDPRHACVVKCFQVKEPQPEKDSQESNQEKAPEAPDDLLNSFFIQELRNLDEAWQRRDIGQGFNDYVTAVSRTRHPRIDVRSEQGLKTAYQCLMPSQAPVGCWPSQYPLVFSQQLAVNEMWRRYSTKPGIFAVNGPPGTGKTTLLRDIVAAVVTQRAQLLAASRNAALDDKATFKCGDKRIPYHPLHQKIQGLAIVVASANNGAVENISLELPGAKAVPESVLDRSDYFSSLATQLLGKPAWGLLAAKLGNKTNREDFMSIFWWRKPKDKQDLDSPPQYFSPDRGEGLSYHLNLIKEGKRSPAMTWSDAIQRFQDAQKAEALIRNDLVRASGLEDQIKALELRVTESNAEWNSLTSKLKQARERCERHDLEISQVQEACHSLRNHLAAAEQWLSQHQANKPNFLAWLSTFGRSHRHWWDRHYVLTQELDSIRHKLSSPLQTLQQMKVKQAELQQHATALNRSMRPLESELEKLNKELNSASDQLTQAKLSLHRHWPDPVAPDEEREKSAPWARDDWRAARETVFLAALDVHRAFIENYPSEIIPNLYLASDWLQGKDLPEKAAAAALDTLCLVVPVISTTFASIPRMFKRIGREAIGWLLIDEAGQALPQQAAGAIWRASRTVVVGDPKQLEPVSGIPPTVEGALAQHYGVPSAWWPSETSVQVLADQTMNLGTYLPDSNPSKDAVWVGSPLRVHRRCDKNPMFVVSNQIAYNGLMVHGKDETKTSLPESFWLDIIGKSSEGNWIHEEGEAVKALLMELRDHHGVQPSDIFLISPFRDCANRLERLAGQSGFDRQKTGTVHTTQGKEAKITILVLGGNPQRPAAKGWAASKPNLLNVAVSRAKQRLYVVGEKRSWEQQDYFSTLAKMLPNKTERMPNQVMPTTMAN